MTDKQLLEQALEALERYANKHRSTYLLDGAWDEEITAGNETITAIRERLANAGARLGQPEQEPVAWVGWHTSTDEMMLFKTKAEAVSWRDQYKKDFASIEGLVRPFLPAAQSAPVQDMPFGVGGALVAIKTLLSRDPCVHANMAIKMIDAILKNAPPVAPVQEPFMWACNTLDETVWETSKHKECEHCVPLYTTPPAAQRQWVRLTIYEMDDAFDASMKVRPKDASSDETRRLFVQAIEAKLKEKNT